MTYKREISPIVNQHQLEAVNSTMCILQNFGPMGFLLQEEQNPQKFKVCRIYRQI